MITPSRRSTVEIQDEVTRLRALLPIYAGSDREAIETRADIEAQIGLLAENKTASSIYADASCSGHRVSAAFDALNWRDGYLADAPSATWDVEAWQAQRNRITNRMARLGLYFYRQSAIAGQTVCLPFRARGTTPAISHEAMASKVLETAHLTRL
jgi:hypothetical protein